MRNESFWTQFLTINKDAKHIGNSVPYRGNAIRVFLSQKAQINILDIRNNIMYIQYMKYIWDENKNRANIKARGIDFRDAKDMFSYPMLICIDNRFDYGEERWVGIGILK